MSSELPSLLPPDLRSGRRRDGRKLRSYRSKAQPLPVVRLSSAEVKKVREKLDMTQREFAEMFGFPLRSLVNWETRRRGVQGAPATLLLAIAAFPDLVQEALRRHLYERAREERRAFSPDDEARVNDLAAHIG